MLVRAALVAAQMAAQKQMGQTVLQIPAEAAGAAGAAVPLLHLMQAAQAAPVS
jgi:hypothetical protein